MRGKYLAAGLGLAGLAAFGVPAVASASVKPDNTGSCGPQCVVLSYQASGTNYVIKDQNNTNTPNNPVNVNNRLTSGNGGAAEDFKPEGLGTVVPDYCNSNGTTVSGMLSNRQCSLLVTDGYSSFPAFQLRHTPFGASDHLCAGLWGNEAVATDGFRIREEPCGVAADTLWFGDLKHAKLIGGRFYAPFINGASDNYSDPEVATENTGEEAYQTQHISQLNLDSHGFVDNTQLITGIPGL